MKTLLLPAALFVTVILESGEAVAARDEAEGPLIDYVTREDASYGWVERRAGALPGAAGAYAELTLTSQTWRGIVWKHQLLIVTPSMADAEARHALLVIEGGVRADEHEGADRNAGAPPPAAALHFAEIGGLLRAPVAVLRQVPYQPLFDGRYEDALIALTFDNYLRTAEPDWPLLLPMVKSAVRAMDAVQEYARQAWSLDIAAFTVTGASKRGWTTWLTAAVDERVAAIAPMVIDMLNLGPQLAHQHATWGRPSPMLHDYTDRGLHEHIDSPAGQALLAAVDPYSHRDRLTQPKLIVLGTNDPYWPLDALNLYWDDLPGENFILYVPNAGHGIGDRRRLVGGLTALQRHVAEGVPLPDLRWEFGRTDGTLTLRVESDIAPREVVAWVAESPSRDFRQARWSAHAFRSDDGGGYRFELPVPEAGYAALFGEAVYDGHGQGEAAVAPYFLSTNVRIVGPE